MTETHPDAFQLAMLFHQVWIPHEPEIPETWETLDHASQKLLITIASGVLSEYQKLVQATMDQGMKARIESLTLQVETLVDLLDEALKTHPSPESRDKFRRRLDTITDAD
jgi:hypothetical protein